MPFNTTTGDTRLLQPGFSDPVVEAQAAFRKILKAMSEPGLIQKLDFELPLNPLDSAVFATLLTLVDNDTSLWLSESFNTDSVRQNLAFHCGCSITDEPETANFLLAEGAGSLKPDQCQQGDPAWPDQSATVILQVADLKASASTEEKLSPSFILSGPGIETTHHLVINGLSESWTEWLLHSHKQFPLGLDLILVCGSRLVALPRSIRVELAATAREVL